LNLPCTYQNPVKPVPERSILIFGRFVMVPFFLWAFGGRRRRQLMFAADSNVAIGATLESAFLLGQ
jgi:hypothetical protein